VGGGGAAGITRKGEGGGVEPGLGRPLNTHKREKGRSPKRGDEKKGVTKKKEAAEKGGERKRRKGAGSTVFIDKNSSAS